MTEETAILIMFTILGITVVLSGVYKLGRYHSNRYLKAVLALEDKTSEFSDKQRIYYQIFWTKNSRYRLEEYTTDIYSAVAGFVSDNDLGKRIVIGGVIHYRDIPREFNQDYYVYIETTSATQGR